VVDEAGDIRRYIPVDHARIARPEKIFPAIFFDLLGRCGVPEIFDDARTLRYSVSSKQTSAAVRPVDGQMKGSRHEALLHHEDQTSFSINPERATLGKGSIVC
jgi:hypothetical protein